MKDQRVALVMSEAELKQLDEWAWANRIRSRSEAIRRLVKMAIEAGAQPSPREPEPRE